MTQSNALAGRKEWIALGVLVLPLLLVSMDITVLYFAVPSIAADLAPSSSQQLWMIDVYGFVLAGMLITMGNIGDLIGRRRLLLIGSTLFGIASVAAAFANSAEMLIAARAVQGLGGATLMPSTLALVSNMFRDDKQRSSAIAVWSIGLSAGAAIGPVISGALLNNFWWGAIFLINVPVLVVLLVAAPALVPEFRRSRAEAGKFDALSSVLSLAGVLSVIWGLKEIAINGFDALPAGAIGAGLVLAAIFLYRQTHLSHPMINPQLFRNRGFGPSISLSLIAFFCLIGFGIFTTQYLMDVQSMKPLEAALWTMASPALTFVLVPFAVIFARKTRPAYIVATAFFFGTTGFAAMTQLTTERNMPLVVYGTVGIGVGAAIVLTMITDLVVAAAPAEQAGSVSALTQTFQELGGALGIAVFGSIGAAAYKHNVDSHAPAGLPKGTLDEARQTLGGAAEAAQHLSAQKAQELLNVAHDAFTSALNTAALLGIGVTVLAGLFTIWRLRHIEHAPEQPAAGGAGLEADTALSSPVAGH